MNPVVAHSQGCQVSWFAGSGRCPWFWLPINFMLRERRDVGRFAERCRMGHSTHRSVPLRAKEN